MNALKESSTVELDRLLGVQIEKLVKHRTTLDHASAALNRAEAPLRAQVDLSPRAVLFRRYESAAARELHKALNHFKSRPDRVEEDENSGATPSLSSESARLASFRDPAQVEVIEASASEVPHGSGPPSPPLATSEDEKNRGPAPSNAGQAEPEATCVAPESENGSENLDATPDPVEVTARLASSRDSVDVEAEDPREGGVGLSPRTTGEPTEPEVGPDSGSRPA